MARLSRCEQERDAEKWGRIDAERGYCPEDCPYCLPHARRAWKRGWRKGNKLRKKVK